MKSASVSDLRPVNIVCKTMTQNRERLGKVFKTDLSASSHRKAQTTRVKKHSHYIVRKVRAIVHVVNLLK